ncbi:hypothetical protein [Saccharibacillus qingshengii]|uniref:hypothetical protein n=1 Tax=Saccharibacillus qingshengii TaxID=1763540 RepID=UPI0015559D71|nr:hypothetical protein [Saccharibacillus qingshengii]
MLAYCERFLDLRARRVVHLRPISPEEAIRSYTEYAYGFFGVTVFSEEQVEHMARRMGKSESEVRLLLDRGLQAGNPGMQE